MFFSKIKKIALLVFLIIICFGLAHFILAADLDVGIEQAAGTGLGGEDPRVMAAKIIRIVLGFLGILALGLIMYAGWLWMTAAGNAEKIEKAKKILTGAIIGLIIILSAFAIVSFILSKLLESTGADIGAGGGGINISGGGGRGAGGLPGIGEPCLTDILDISCAVGVCSAGLACGDGCLCRESGAPGEGESCDGDNEQAGCQEVVCAGNLLCSAGDNCTCVRSPLIAWVSPLDASDTPNGAPGNFITIGGVYFGTTVGQVIFMGDPDNAADDKIASFPDSVNPNCTSFWQDDQIIAVVPTGAVDGPIKVIADSKKEDATNDDRGPKINNFDINDLVRPGLCLASPAGGFFGDKFNLQGNGFAGADQKVLFGNEIASTSANNVSNWTNVSVDAAVPNIAAGRNAVFASINARSSNSLRFTVNDDAFNNPAIDYIEPPRGPTGQYITIYGRNFKQYKAGASAVKFYLPADPNNLINADIDFPKECQDKWWRDSYIIVKVPKTEVNEYKITVTNEDKRVSQPADFSITTGAPGPGLCALVPHNGPVGQKVSAHGANFGSTQGKGKAVFFNNKEGTTESWIKDKIESSVPAGAETGPFKAVNDGGDTSNSLPFKVGSCSANSECELGEECCASGTYWAGICRNEGTCNEGAPTICGYGWTFSTSPDDTPKLTCSGYTNAKTCLSAGGCPNSPGQCQTNTAVIVGKGCGDSFCNSNYSVCAGKCAYEASLNKCKLGGSKCDETKVVAGHKAECRETGGKGVWQIDMGGASCPAGSFLDINNWCTLGSLANPQICQLCSVGFVCQSGQCVVNSLVCPEGSACSNNQCVKISGICECCCRVDNSAQDCCAGLNCEPGNCGPGAPDYGLCTGCKVVVNSVINQEASDNACNCKGGSTRFCDLSNMAFPNGVCRDRGDIGTFCDSNVATPVCEPNNSICQPGLFCDVNKGCTCQPGGDIGDSCDSDISTPTCDANNNMCEPGLFCDVNKGCTCQSGGMAGQECELNSLPACSIGAAACASDFRCLNKESSDCRCCCTPGTKNAAGLECLADKPPCDNADRGLFCGCSADNQCGDISIVGCGFDTCCHSRPEVEAIEPAAGAVEVCRNAEISAAFDQFMDPASFTGRVIVIGDYGMSQCPAGTEYLTLNKKGKIIIAHAKNRIANLLVKIPIAGRLFTDKEASALTGNFCAASGSVGSYNTADNKTVLTFKPAKLLDGGRKYYVIIRGDANIGDQVNDGVLSYYGISMNGPANEIFNAVTYKGKIWSFTTMSEQAENNGVCVIDHTEIQPVSYLFKTNKNDLNEKDNNPNDVTFDTVKDSDKVFVARALDNKKKVLSSVAGYSWDWEWSASKPTAADFVSVSGLSSDKKLVRAREGVTDDKTNITATANVSDNSKFSAIATAYVFICDNPWPPPIGGLWRPWQDANEGMSCVVGSGGCFPANYEIYYCRDAGGKGTVDDLPAILSDDTIIRGQSEAQNIFKDYYFLREQSPSVSTLTITDQATGGKVFATWSAVPAVNGYKLYYGTAKGKYSDFADAGNITSRIVSGLTNGKTYYFAVTAYYASGAESGYSKEVSVVPTDKTPPAVPTGLKKTSVAGDSITLAWNANSDDTVGYKVYYGVSPGVYGESLAAGKNISLAVTNLSSGAAYYFAITAVDAYNNESVKSGEISVTTNQ